MRHVGFVEDAKAILEPGPTLVGGPEETPIDREISDRATMNLSPPGRTRGEKKSSVDGIIQGRVYSATFRRKGSWDYHFTDMHAMKGGWKRGV
jgi:hypothetical protein